MPRPVKYRTPEEKKAANRAKSNRSYAKKKASANVDIPISRRKYHTDGERKAANRSKSNLSYAKNKSVIRMKRSVSHRETSERNQFRLPLATVAVRPAIVNVKLTHRTTTPSDIDTDTDACPESDLTYWCAQAEAVAVKLEEHIGRVAFNYLDTVCVKYLFTRRKDDIRDEIISISNLQKSIYRCQDNILELGGLGAEWERARDISNEVVNVINFLEDILCWAMVDPEELAIMHRRRELRYQGAVEEQ